MCASCDRFWTIKPVSFILISGHERKQIPIIIQDFDTETGAGNVMCVLAS